MELVIKKEALIFLGTFLSGFLLGLICDVLGISKNKKTANIIFIGIKDMLFCVSMSFVFFIIIYILNNGVIRWYEIVSVISGFIIYVLSIKKYVLLFLDVLKTKTKIFIMRALMPCIPIFKLFKMPCVKIKNAFKWSKKLFKTVKYKQNLTTINNKLIVKNKTRNCSSYYFNKN